MSVSSQLSQQFVGDIACRQLHQGQARLLHTRGGDGLKATVPALLVEQDDPAAPLPMPEHDG